MASSQMASIKPRPRSLALAVEYVLPNMSKTVKSRPYPSLILSGVSLTGVARNFFPSSFC